MGTYSIDGCNEMFLTLQEAKKHTLTAIRVNKNGKVSYGRTVKY